jgi:hypothetical protein
MKLKFTVLLTLALIFFTLTSAKAGSLNRTFTDKEYGYSIKHFSSWSSRIYRSGIVLAEINDKNSKSGLQIRQIRSEENITDFLDNYIVNFTKTMGADLLRTTEISMGYETGFALSFRANRNGNDYFLKSYILKKNNSLFFIFQSGTPYAKRGEIEPALDAMAESFESQ